MSDEETKEEILENVSDTSVEPLEVKVVKEKEKIVEEDLDYMEYDITEDEIKESDDGINK